MATVLNMNQFYEILDKIKHNYRWHLTFDAICGIPKRLNKKDPIGVEFCPMVVILHSQRRRYEQFNPGHSSLMFGHDNKNIPRIMSAIDDKYTPHLNIRRKIVKILNPQ